MLEKDQRGKECEMEEKRRRRKRIKRENLLKRR